MRRLFIMFGSAGVVLVAVAVVAVLASLWLYNCPGPSARAGEKTTVLLRKGSGLNEIAGKLKQDGVIRSAPVFLIAAQVTGAGRRLKAGEYEFASGASMRRVLADIRDGKVVRHQVTIPEGWTSQMVVAALNRETALSGSVPTPPEGAILPETYEFQRGEERSAVLQRMMDDRDSLLAALWEQRKPGLPLRTPDEAVTLASIVEKETGVPSERPRVAAVFVNRLRQGMKLQSDPTIIYALTGGKPLGRGIRASELAAATPYNTYVIEGLPPTPIANPGRASLAAVLAPPESNELYFVADGTGGHVFASTLADHERNVARWRQVEKTRPAAPAAKTGR